MDSPAPKRSNITTAGYVASAVGVVTWIVYLVLRYAMGKQVTMLLWVAFGLVILGFALRRSQG